MKPPAIASHSTAGSVLTAPSGSTPLYRVYASKHWEATQGSPVTKSKKAHIPAASSYGTPGNVDEGSEVGPRDVGPLRSSSRWTRASTRARFCSRIHSSCFELSSASLALVAAASLADRKRSRSSIISRSCRSLASSLSYLICLRAKASSSRSRVDGRSRPFACC